jgi:hypothetical protein
MPARLKSDPPCQDDPFEELKALASLLIALAQILVAVVELIRLVRG